MSQDKPKNETDEDKAIDQIEAQDKTDALDELYEQESDPEAPMLVIGDEKHPRLAKLKTFKFWFLVFLALVVAAIFVWLITPSRIWLLNSVGARTTLDISTLVATTEGTPPMLKNATVVINGKMYQTDDKGTLHVGLPYGDAHIAVSKQGYQTATKDETLDFDPFFGKLGGLAADANLRKLSFPLTNVGVTVTFTAKDWLTGQPLTAGTFSVGDVAAAPGSDGVVTLALPATDAKTVQVDAKFTAKNYANTAVTVPVGTAKPDITFVPAGKDYFLSKRTGQFGVYSAGLDGSSVTEVVPPSPNETGDIMFTVSPDGKYGVLGSTREATRDTFGSVQQKLYLVDLASNKLTAFDTALRFTAVDWAGDTLVYTALVHGGGGTVQRLGSLDASAAKQIILATVSNFTVVRVRLGSALYLLSTGELRVVKVKGGTEKSLGTGISHLVQTDADHFAYQSADQVWHQYDANADQVGNATTPTTTTRAFLAATSADNQMQLVLDTIDGKPTLIAKNVGSGKETPLYVGSGLAGPIRWVGNVAVYRADAADYAASPSGSAPKKITDVSPTISQTHDYLTFN